MPCQLAGRDGARQSRNVDGRRDERPDCSHGQGFPESAQEAPAVVRNGPAGGLTRRTGSDLPNQPTLTPLALADYFSGSPS